MIRIMKRIVALSLAAVLLLPVASCSTSSAESTSTEVLSSAIVTDLSRWCFSWPSLYDKAKEQFPSAELVYVEGADHYCQSVGREDVKQGSLEFIQKNI